MYIFSNAHPLLYISEDKEASAAKSAMEVKQY